MPWWIWAAIGFGAFMGSAVISYMFFDLITGRWNDEARKYRR